MAKRGPISKKTRFEVFKRDSFTCQYCGQKPPAVVLEVDHVLAVANGGSSEDHNLLTSCFDCNRGKGKRELVAAPIDLAERAALIEERRAQVAAYEEAIAEERAHQDCEIDEVAAIYESAFKGWTLSDNGRRSVRQFLGKLTPSEVKDAMEMAAARVTSDRAFKYFCGVCWRKIRGEA